ncbi:L-xylulose reductase-like [Schistocerca americana]|uniref:L-xylulose reductase-like n=1 Tax=Schistocerca americana TaxID=7009 RepID=UPI001F4F6022|nr:L-xylulose reductase-like [Schistocerca americana]XP_047108159.1 L-xylulose reductase-like [Schistocerca piceifrons]XP_049951666.1 L-xylulose reductase-like [Schistocerca serialis cubense]
MDISFQNKRVLVTGAGQGIGRELVKALVRYGAEVIALSRTKKHLDTLCQEVNVTPVCVDLSDWETAREAVRKIGPVDCLVNNAAVALLDPFLKAKPEDFDKSFAINVKAVLNVSQVVAESMIQRGKGGTIVNLSSQASQAALADHAIYCASKAAVDQLSKVMALELGPHNIRVNCVNPTVVMTEMGKIGWSKPEKAATMLSKIPMGRFAEPEDVVNAVIFLLSSKSDMINGICVPIDGGFLAC